MSAIAGFCGEKSGGWMEEMYRQLQPPASNLRPDQGHIMFTIRDHYGQSRRKISVHPLMPIWPLGVRKSEVSFCWLTSLYFTIHHEYVLVEHWPNQQWLRSSLVLLSSCVEFNVTRQLPSSLIPHRLLSGANLIQALLALMFRSRKGTRLEAFCQKHGLGKKRGFPAPFHSTHQKWMDLEARTG